MSLASGPITELLAQARAGESSAWDAVVALVYADLRRLAHGQLRHRPGDHTLDTTGLVHECWLRLAHAACTPADRNHFLALAARVMRQVVCDYARERLAQKRGGGAALLPLDEVDVAEVREAEKLLELDDLLRKLAARDERLARVVECRFFAGLSEPETAAALAISERSVQRAWAEAREWLAAQ